MSAALSAMGCDIVTGGGPGLMQAANEGARESAATERVHNIGIRVALPFEQAANPYVEQSSSIRRSSPACITSCSPPTPSSSLPGGIGTVLESMMIWQLLQVRHLHDTPLIFAGPMWKGLVDWAKEAMLRPGFELASAQDMQIPRCVAGRRRSHRHRARAPRALAGRTDAIGLNRAISN